MAERAGGFRGGRFACAATVWRLKVKTVADGGRDRPFTISLKGFPDAFDRTATLAK